jgi:hypothetical protein
LNTKTKNEIERIKNKSAPVFKKHAIIIGAEPLSAGNGGKK